MQDVTLTQAGLHLLRVLQSAEIDCIQVSEEAVTYYKYSRGSKAGLCVLMLNRRLNPVFSVSGLGAACVFAHERVFVLSAEDGFD